jgi:hypothetical protein
MAWNGNYQAPAENGFMYQQQPAADNAPNVKTEQGMIGIGRVDDEQQQLNMQLMNGRH